MVIMENRPVADVALAKSDQKVAGGAGRRLIVSLSLGGACDCRQFLLGTKLSSRGLWA